VDHDKKGNDDCRQDRRICGLLITFLHEANEFSALVRELKRG
jgi:hypothetical protein